MGLSLKLFIGGWTGEGSDRTGLKTGCCFHSNSLSFLHISLFMVNLLNLLINIFFSLHDGFRRAPYSHECVMMNFYIVPVSQNTSSFPLVNICQKKKKKK